MLALLDEKAWMMISNNAVSDSVNYFYVHKAGEQRLQMSPSLQSTLFILCHNNPLENQLLEVLTCVREEASWVWIFDPGQITHLTGIDGE